MRLVEPLGGARGGDQRKRTARDLQIFASSPSGAVQIEEIDERSAARAIDGSCGGEKEGDAEKEGEAEKREKGRKEGKERERITSSVLASWWSCSTSSVLAKVLLMLVLVEVHM